MYRKLDKAIPKIKKEVRRLFNRLSVFAFDELNPVRIQAETQNTFSFLKDTNLQYFMLLAQYSYEKAVEDARKAGYEFADIFMDAASIVQEVLESYNLTTGYLYEGEAERKRLRLSESLSTAVTYLNRELYSSTLKRTASLWFTQSVQYALSVTDYAYIKTLKNAGVQYVQWVAEKDNSTCDKCKVRGGNVYPIEDVPPKEHYGCRCILKPIDSQERL